MGNRINTTDLIGVDLARIRHVSHFEDRSKWDVTISQNIMTTHINSIRNDKCSVVNTKTRSIRTTHTIFRY